VRFRLEFFKPFAATNSAEFAFAPEGGGTRVTWTMQGRNNFIGKAMGLVFDFDKMIGADFEAGLAGIQTIVEKR
jgi:two-component sensor histidine kinase